MATVTYLDNSIECAVALKGADFVHLLDDNGTMIAAFDEVSDFSGFAITGGEWATPTADNDCYLAVLRDDGTIGKSDQRCSDIGRRNCAYNLLDNSYFKNPVNQRGLTSYSGGGYTIDRWKENQTAMSVAVEDGYILLKNTSDSRRAFEQVLPDSHIGKVMTVAVKEHDSGTVYCASAVVPSASSDAQYFAAADFGAHTARLSMTSSGVLIFQVMVGNASPATLDWVALYEGEYTVENLPAYVPKGYAAELQECMRYYVRMPSNVQLTFTGYGASATAARFSIPVGVKMRATPEMRLGDISECRILPGDITPTGIGGRAVVGPLVTFGVTAASGVTPSVPAVFQPGTVVELIAEL